MANLGFDSIWNLMQQYDFELNNDFSNDLICTICKKLMKNACNGICGCKYCFDCIRDYLDSGNMYCPGVLQFCKEDMINIDENIHLDHPVNHRISRTIVKCPLESCEHKDQLRNMEEHLRTCKSWPVNCPYFNIGCDKDKLGEDKMKDHLGIENYRHTKLLIEYVDNQKNEMELLNREVVELRQDNNHHKVEIGELQANLKVNCDQVELLNEEMSALKNENRSIKEQINNLIDKDRKKQAKSDVKSRQIDRWKEKSDQSDKSIKKIEDKTENLNLKIGQMQTNLDKQNEFLWVIEGISGKMKEAKEGITTWIFSDAFYSHKNGYKMCLQLFPDGFGTDKGSHLSVYICVMRGPFDDILSWPFKNDVTISLMNQQSGLVHVGFILRYEDVPNDPGYLKPTEERNIASGFPQFIELNEFLTNAALIKDDKIIFKCSVQF